MRNISLIKWPSKLFELQRIEDLFRCGICYEFMNTTVLTPCSHNYCSLCIRKYLQCKPECPACFKVTYEKDLRINRLLDELIESYLNVRDILGKLINGVEKTKIFESSEKEEFLPITPAKNKQRNNNSKINNENFKQKNSPKVSKNTGNKNGIKSNTNVNDRLQTDDKLEAMPESSVESVKNTSSPSSSLKNEKISSFFISPKSERVNNCTNSVDRTNSVNCPKCYKSVFQNYINDHLDECLKRDEAKRSQLPKLVLKLMNDAQLRKKLKEYGLKTQGDRRTLESRYRRYVVLYNAECDKPNPRPISELIKQCEQVEMEEKKLQRMNEMGMKLKVNRNSSTEVIEKECKKYLDMNKDIFQNLIRDIKKRKPNEGKCPSPTSSTSGKDLNRSNISVVSSDESQFINIEDTFTDSDSNLCPLQKYVSDGNIGHLSGLNNDGDSPIKHSSPIKSMTPETTINKLATVEESPSNTLKRKDSYSKSVYDEKTASELSEPEEMFESPTSKAHSVNKKRKLSGMPKNCKRSLKFHQRKYKGIDDESDLSNR